ncbi:conserved hypothetical protein [Beutenbergia cavernae DSM 12333]|uniref:Alpha glucuronidase N-terminal domain-containing protein n=1 Tax=Beutenbergia cavernae (strain ATCC BAA-8 / DSM 12333 / CCUG 43141 / JCM 11478 / NBRC 16432 / NCIMB 13614 / HKI 0122) TaxID=471853 RepID=C5BYZ6_BEUC1|nr:DUF4838 domain-containing protein [Beutenbergia cavernae]ACQ81111.1 conserved hypothetical protein [Beutenbergia cavernae DSM 12333]
MTEQPTDRVAQGLTARGGPADVPQARGTTRRTVLGAGVVGVAGTLATATAAGAETHGAGGGRLVLASGGRTDYVVQVAADETPVVRHAAQELADYLHEITGARFDLVSAPPRGRGRKVLLVGRAETLDSEHGVDAGAVGVDPAALGDDGFALRTFSARRGSRDDVLIAGGTERGTLYGVSWFLDRLCGVRWFAPTYTAVPDERRLSLRRRDVDGDHVPRFRFREVFASDGFDPVCRQHNLLNGRSLEAREVPAPPEVDTWSGYWPWETHNFHQIVPDQQLWSGGQLLAMEPRTREAAATELVRRIDAKLAEGGPAAHGFGQMDWGWTPDAESRAFADAHGGALSAPVIDMVNEVAERVRQEIPGARIGTLAYLFSLVPPTDLSVDDGVVVTMAPLQADFGRPLIDDGNAEFSAAIQGWSDLTGEIVVWTYNTNFHDYLMPFPNYRPMFTSVAQLAERGIQGYFGQAAWDMGGGAELADLRMWVLARLLWDPEQDAAALVREFADGFYGAGGRHVAEYMDLLSDAFERTQMRLPCYVDTVVVPYLDVETAHRADQLLAAAERAVRRDHERLAHVREARIGMDLVVLKQRRIFARDAERLGISWDLDVERRLRRVLRALSDAGTTAFREILGGPAIGDMGWLRTLVSVMPREAPVPEEAAGLPESDWADFSVLELDLYPPVTSVLADDAASDGYLARMPGDVPDWGFQLNLGQLPDDGPWRLHAVVRADTGDAADDAVAMRMGVYPGTPTIDLTVEQVGGEEFRTVEIPGTYGRSFDVAFWMSPPDSDSVAHVDIDRVVAVRA